MVFARANAFRDLPNMPKQIDDICNMFRVGVPSLGNIALNIEMLKL